jgi:hypothetical protein
MMHTYIWILPQKYNYCHQVAENLKSVGKASSKVSFIIISEDLLIYVQEKQNIYVLVYIENKGNDKNN